MNKINKKLSVVVWDYQIDTQQQEDNEIEMSRPEMQVVTFTLYEKMAEVQQIQTNIEVGVPSIRAACKMAKP